MCDPEDTCNWCRDFSDPTDGCYVGTCPRCGRPIAVKPDKPSGEWYDFIVSTEDVPDADCG